MIIKQTVKSILGTTVEYLVFDNEENLAEYKIQQELLRPPTAQYIIVYDKLHINVIRLFPIKEFENTSLEQFNKLLKLLDK